jgi:hypothetical protein|tara:strand:+ start:84 stop:260 length:177 start_codon:yes stop_codon:yes gene_type:complete
MNINKIIIDLIKFLTIVYDRLDMNEVEEMHNIIGNLKDVQSKMLIMGIKLGLSNYEEN